MTQPSDAPPTALDATGAPSAIPYAQLGAAWKAGQAQPIAGQLYYLQHQNGAIGHTTDPAVMHAALEQGATFIDPSQAQSAIEDKRLEGSSGGAVGAFAGGAIQQGTLGLSDVAGEAIGGEGFSKAREYQRRAHPFASALGEGAGAVGLAALTGGGSLAEEGAGFAARELGGLGESTLARIAQRGMLGAARAGAEGAQMGVAQAVSDAAFDNHKLTASQIASTIGMNALWGAGTGGALSLVGGGLGAAGSKLFGRSAATDEDLATVASKALGEEPSAGLGAAVRKGYARVAGAVSGKDPDAILHVLENRADLADADEIRAAAAKAIRASGDDVTRNGDMVREIWSRGIKRSYIADAVKGVDPEVAAQTSRNMLDETLTQLDAMAKDPDAYGGAEPLKRAIKIAKRASKQLDEAINGKVREGRVPLGDIEPKAPWSEEKLAATRQTVGKAEPIELYEGIGEGGKHRINDGIHRYNAAVEAGETDIRANLRTEGDHVADMYGTLDDLKKAIGKYTVGAKMARGGATDELIAQQNQARFGAYKGLYEKLRTGLEDESTWGEMGTKQKEVNAIYTNQIDASKRFNRALTTDIGRDPSDPWERMTGIDPEKVDSYVKNLTNPSKDLTHQAVNDYVDHTEALTRKMLEHFDLAPAERTAVEKVANSAQAMRETLSTTTDRLSTVNQYQKLQEQTAGHALGFGLLAGHMMGGGLGGLEGMALGKVASIFTRPAETIHQLAVVEKMVRESDSRIARALRGFISGGARTAKIDEIASYGRRAGQIERLNANPAALNDKIVTATANLRTHAPKLADAVTAAAVESAKYLSSKLPPRLPADPFDPKAKPLQPSARQKEQFLRSYKAVEDPLSVVDDLRDGRLSLEGIDAIKSLHPDLYQRVQTMAIERMADGKMVDLKPQQRTGLGLMMGLPVPELDPAYVIARQQAWTVPFGGAGPATIGEGGKPQQPPTRRSKPVNLTKSAATLPADRLAAGVGADRGT